MKINTYMPVIFFLACLAGFTNFAIASEKKCKSLYDKGLHSQAILICREASIGSSSTGKLYLGLMYLMGQGVERNASLGSRLIKESAQLGNAEAIEKIARFYRSGEWGDKDLTASCDWWERLASLGDALGQEKLGVCYLRGQGRDKDVKLGYAYLSLAAKNGSHAAEYIIDTYSARFPEAEKQEALDLADQLGADY